MTTIQRQDSKGKWWVHLDCDGHFDPDLIAASSNSVWRYDGAPCDAIMGPYDTEEEAMAWVSCSSPAWEQAIKEGLEYFWAQLFDGNLIAFVGQSWEDGGFHINDAGVPVRDAHGNTVVNHLVEALDPANARHVAQVEEWHNG